MLFAISSICSLQIITNSFNEMYINTNYLIIFKTNLDKSFNFGYYSNLIYLFIQHDFDIRGVGEV